MESVVIQIAYCLFGVAIGYLHLKNKLYGRAVLTVLFGIMPIIYVHYFPFSTMSIEDQLSSWQIAMVIVYLSGLGMILLTILLTISSSIKRLLTGIILFLFIFMYLFPLHRHHQGWEPHAHFMWDNPLHLH